MRVVKMSNTIYSSKNISKKYNYTYLITEVSTGLKYIGVRSSSIEPSKDLGFKYFSSSSNKEFIKKQKQNPYEYNYEILDTFNLRIDANNHEIYLHNLYNVHINETYINKSKSTSSKFCSNNTNKVIVVDRYGTNYSVYKTDYRYIYGEFKSIMCGKTIVKDLNGNGMIVKVDDYRLKTGELVGIKAGTVTVVDINGNYQTVKINDPRYISGELVHNTKNKITVKDKNGNTMSVEKRIPDIYLANWLGIVKEHICQKKLNKKCLNP